MPCRIWFCTDQMEYITNSSQMIVEGVKDIFKFLRDCGGSLNSQQQLGFQDINKIYFKWYDYMNQREYSVLNECQKLEFKFSIEYKKSYYDEPAYCIECSFHIEQNKQRNRDTLMRFNILLDSNLNVIGIDPCCNYGIVLTKCILEFSVVEYKDLLFYNEI